MAKEPLEIRPAGIKLLKKSITPLYKQVYEQFRQMILNKQLRPGDRLPASRNLAKELGVSRVIVSQGFEQLMMEGYIVGKTGSGTFVASIIPDVVLNAPKVETNGEPKIRPGALKVDEKGNFLPVREKTEIRPFQMGEPSLDQFPYKIWQQVGNKVLKELKSYHLGYDDCCGYWPLRKAIASYLRVSRAVRCEAGQVIVVTGSQQGLNLIVKCLLKTGDNVWMEDPGYFGASNAFSSAGVNIYPIPVEEDGLNIDYAMKKFGDAKLAYVTPSHQFPLGYTMSQSKRLQLIQWAKKKNAWILEDDYDSEFRYRGQPLACLQGLDDAGRVIYSGTFSKVLFPGLRLAYLVLPTPDLVEEFKKIKENIDRQSPVIEQLILTRYMEQGHFLRHIRKMRLLYAERQSILTSLLHEQAQSHFRVEVSHSGMHLICWLSPEINIRTLREEIERQHLVVSFINDYSIEKKLPPAMALGFTAFSKYKLRVAVEKLMVCIRQSLS